MGRAWRTELAFTERTTTFGPVTASIGLGVIPITGLTVAVPDLPFACEVRAQAVCRMALADVPAFAIAGVGDASAVEIILTDLDRFCPIVFPTVGNQVVEQHVMVAARLPAHSPGVKQMFIGAHDNTNPPIFLGPKAISAVVGGVGDSYNPRISVNR